MSPSQDGPSTSLFIPLPLKGNGKLGELAGIGNAEDMSAAGERAPSGQCVGWGIPFEIGDVVILKDQTVTIEFPPVAAQWLVFMHTSDLHPSKPGPAGFISPMRGEGQLGEHAADYVILYVDGAEERAVIRRRFQLGSYLHRWGENCFEAVPHHKPHPLRAAHEQLNPDWGLTQTRISLSGTEGWENWLWAWENPNPEKKIAGIRFEPVSGMVVVSAVSAGNAASQPLRWRSRRKAVLSLPPGNSFQPDLDEHGLLRHIQIDLGQVSSATPRSAYPNDKWAETYNNQLPQRSDSEVVVEYTGHEDASFHLENGRTIPVKEVEQDHPGLPLQPVAESTRRVTLRAVDSNNGKPVPVKLHVHGEWSEYLAPVDRHRIPNTAWFEDYSVDFVHVGADDETGANPHFCTYIPGETTIDLPVGNVYIEMSKGFEIRPIRKVVQVNAATREINIEIERDLPWRSHGWVTADTHVHFLSSTSALLEGSAEGVNVINLLASQWGELMTNGGDFDGRTTWGSKKAGGYDETLVRVGTENRQSVLGHISLLGYSGRMITPLTTGGPHESALGDPVEILLTEWARQCKKQGGLVVIPHFPDPRLEPAATIVSGNADAIEMTSWGNLYNGIDPYSLADWYRYLNCDYLVPAVGGTDKMTAITPVGAVRTYARIDTGQPFTYEAWMEAVRRGETFVTYGPLLEFNVDGLPMGSRKNLPASGGTIDVTWYLASVTIPMSRVELIVNGEIRESVAVDSSSAKGNWSVNVDSSCWLALLVRGHYVDQPEIITAHSSPVMITVEGAKMLAAADAVTILEQIEGSLAYLDTIGTRSADAAYKRMRLNWSQLIADCTTGCMHVDIITTTYQQPTMRNTNRSKSQSW
jgi:hypothetical protein